MASLQELNRLSEKEALKQLYLCCGSSLWAKAMAQSRPFQTPQELFQAAKKIWESLAPSDWKEAFAQHPKIGERKLPPSGTGAWARKEQAQVATAPQEILTALAEGNKSYEEKFGYIFIVCATGKNAQEMLAILRERLNHDIVHELSIAAAEQAKITELRLKKLLEESL